MSEWESWVTEAEDQLATVRVMSPAPPRPSAPGPARPGAAAIFQIGPAATTTTRPESAARGFADEREVEQWAAAARRLRFGEETVRAASKTSATFANRTIAPTSTTFAATETNPSPRWKPFSPFVAPSHAAEDRRAESPGDLIDLRTPVATEMDPGTRHDDTSTRRRDDDDDDDNESALERLNLVDARLRDAVATRLVERETSAAKSRVSRARRSRYGEDAVAEWWADCHWRARTVARCARAWRETTLERVARERRILAEKAAELAALARARSEPARGGEARLEGDGGGGQARGQVVALAVSLRPRADADEVQNGAHLRTRRVPRARRGEAPGFGLGFGRRVRLTDDDEDGERVGRTRGVPRRDESTLVAPLAAQRRGD